jgi:hypothetical protein
MILHVFCVVCMCVCVGDYVSLAIEPYNLGDYGNEINK